MKVIDLVRAVDQHRQVQLLGDVGGFGDQHAVDRQRHAGGLVGLHLGAEHRLARSLAHVVEGLDQLDAAGLAAAAGMDLRLDHPEVAADGLGRLDRLVGRAGDAPGRHRDAVVGEQLLGLVFVEVHASPGSADATSGPGSHRAPIVADRAGKGKSRAAASDAGGRPSRHDAEPRMPPADAARHRRRPALRRELYFFTLYRMLEAGTAGARAVQPAGPDHGGDPRARLLAAGRPRSATS